jgi:hypothetical protein
MNHWAAPVLSLVDKKSSQLGMHYSTAAARLDRMVLFMLIQRCSLDSCFQCGKKIERWQDLSTEHKQPWQDTDPALFWDLSNIAFSHKSCNFAAARRQDPKIVIPFLDSIRPETLNEKAPEGMAWCSGHQTYLSRDLFDKNTTKKNGLQSGCKECRA